MIDMEHHRYLYEGNENYTLEIHDCFRSGGFSYLFLALTMSEGENETHNREEIELPSSEMYLGVPSLW